MGIIGDAVMSAAKSSYQGNFRFSAELAKGLAVGDSFLPVFEFSGGPLSKVIYLNSDKVDDQSILLAITAVRSYKFLRLVLWDDASISSMQELRVRNIPIFVSLGVQRNVFGKRVELYVLRDNAATILDIEPHTGYGGTKRSRIRLELSSPELLHGVGDGWNLKKV